TIILESHFIASADVQDVGPITLLEANHFSDESQLWTHDLKQLSMSSSTSISPHNHLHSNGPDCQQLQYSPTKTTTIHKHIGNACSSDVLNLTDHVTRSHNQPSAGGAFGDIWEAALHMKGEQI